MTPERERPLILLPLTAALAVYGLAKSDFILPPIALLAMIAGYRLASPRWFSVRALYYAALALALPAYLYQRALLKPGLAVYIFWPGLANTAVVMLVIFLALIWFLPPAPNRGWAMLLISFGLTALSGNYSDPFMYHPAIAAYLAALLIYFKADQKRRETRAPPGPAPRSAPRSALGRAWYAGVYLGFAALAAAAGLLLIAATAKSEGLIMALGAELNRFYEGGDSLRLAESWQSGSVSGWEGSDEAIMVIEGEGPVPEYFRLQVFYRYDYRGRRGTWFEGGKETPVSASGGDTRPMVLAPAARSRWKYRVTSVAPLVKELPLPPGAARVWSEFSLSYYPASGLIERWREGWAGQTRAFEMEGGDAPLPDCGDECRRAALVIPEPVRAALRGKALAITGGEPTGRGKARALVRHFQRYNYSLEPQHRSGPDPVLEFMAGDTATGLCRDFAEAAVLLLRSVDVPARAVGGFLVTEPTGEGSHAFYIKRRNLHAWIEVYCPEDDRWEMFDPTPAAALDAALGRNATFSQWLRDIWDRVRFRLHRAANYVRNLTLSDALAEFTGKRIAAAVGTIIGAIFALYLWRRRGRIRLRRRSKGPGARGGEAAAISANPAGAAYAEFLAWLAARGVAAAAHETATEVIERVAAVSMEKGLPLADCREFISLYRSVRFRMAPGAEMEAAAARLSAVLGRIATAVTSTPPIK